MKLRQEFEYQLNQPLEYHSGGAVVEAKTLLCVAPSMNQLNQTAKLKQGFFKALKNAQQSRNQAQETQAPADVDLNADMVMGILYMGDIDLVDYFNDFKSLLINGVCKIDGLVDLSAHNLNKMAISDLEQLLGQYIANFLIPSWLK